MGGGVHIVCSSKTEDQSWMGGGRGAISQHKIAGVL